MYKSLKIAGLAGAASVLALIPAAAAAQDQSMPGTTAPAMPDAGTATTMPSTPPTAPLDTTTGTYPGTVPTGTPTPQTDAPPEDAAPTTISVEEQQAAIANWPAETRTYYQSLTEDRQKMFWALSDSDKVRLSQLPEEQREIAWSQIEGQIKSKG